MTAVECAMKSGPYRRHVSCGGFERLPLTGKNSSVGLRITWYIQFTPAHKSTTAAPATSSRTASGAARNAMSARRTERHRTRRTLFRARRTRRRRTTVWATPADAIRSSMPHTDRHADTESLGLRACQLAIALAFALAAPEPPALAAFQANGSLAQVAPVLGGAGEAAATAAGQHDLAGRRDASVPCLVRAEVSLRPGLCDLLVRRRPAADRDGDVKPQGRLVGKGGTGDGPRVAAIERGGQRDRGHAIVAVGQVQSALGCACATTSPRTWSPYSSR